MPAAAPAAFGSRLLAAGVAPCGLGARDTLRLEAAMNLYGSDMDESISPLEAGLELDRCLGTCGPRLHRSRSRSKQAT